MLIGNARYNCTCGVLYQRYEKENQLWLIVGPVVGCVGGLIIITIIIVVAVKCCRKRRNKPKEVINKDDRKVTISNPYVAGSTELYETCDDGRNGENYCSPGALKPNDYSQYTALGDTGSPYYMDPIE